MARKAPLRAVSEQSSGLSPVPDNIVQPSFNATLTGLAHERTKPKRDSDGTAATELSDIITTPKKGTRASNGSTPKGTKGTKVKKEVTEVIDIGRSSPAKKSRKRKVVEDKEKDGSKFAESASPRKRKKAKVEKAEETEEGAIDIKGEPALETKVKIKRKTKEEKAAEKMPLAARTIGHRMFLGAHVSASGGVQNAVGHAVHIGANAFALFLKSQRKWVNPPLEPTVCTQFHDHIDKHTYDSHKHVLPHGSYLVNLAHTDPERTKQAYDSFLDDLRRCERLGITLYNFHPGNVQGKSRSEAIAHLASNLNRAHKETTNVVTVLETMAAGGNTLGSTFEELRDVIALIDDKSRVGVCLDTCHTFAAGYDLRTPQALQSTLSRFDATVGMPYLRALHMNDSKAPLSSHRDLHANIGTGYLGLRAFHAIMQESRFEGLPMVLETPIELRDADGELVKDEKGKPKEDKGIWAREIKMLESFVGMDADGEEFLELEKKLARKGATERKRVGDQVYRREEKVRQKAEKAAKGKRKKTKDAESSESELSELDDEEV